MRPLNLQSVFDFIYAQIGPQFHAKKIAKIRNLTLDDVIKRKNPYLFRAKSTNSAHDFIKSVLDATVSSGEETTFGNFLENVAIFVCEKVYDGRKSGVVGLDLEFEDNGSKYLISIKSGPNWGNSGQIKNLVNNFNTAKKTLATSGGAANMNIICVEACCYGIDNVPHKGTHLKLCGQSFWELISGGRESLYKDIIEPLGHMAKERNDEIELLCSEKLNIFTAAFVERFCDAGIINWDRLIRFNSGKK
ncbi:PmeII family type II restriction endonuclease [Janthinobacterium aquaticum]|uniref:PmeII family type II restriction endonuclease n=1 Tax=Janthinobacterium sp. FT58W TaxID=2654254 RepID=UPI00126414BA|nr:PmeII family type II restriction endonuclease [Janthinobacterium sp. FT58W]KAB8041138.1 cytosolic protein [Janthinobacterium sp. FT58W]